MKTKVFRHFFRFQTSCPLRSAAARKCFVPRTHNSFGDPSFSAAGPRVWNNLPPHLRQDMNFARFQHKLKTFLLGC